VNDGWEDPDAWTGRADFGEVGLNARSSGWQQTATSATGRNCEVILVNDGWKDQDAQSGKADFGEVGLLRRALLFHVCT